MRQYGMFERKPGTKTWTRVAPTIYGTKPAMVQFAQNWLLAGALGQTREPIQRCLRPLPLSASERVAKAEKQAERARIAAEKFDVELGELE
jgi:hypothetical protein